MEQRGGREGGEREEAGRQGGRREAGEEKKGRKGGQERKDPVWKDGERVRETERARERVCW